MTNIDGTYALLRAMFHQVELDSTAAEPRYRADVQRWLREGSLAWWDALLGCDGVLERAIRQRLAARRAQCPRQEEAQLAFPFSEEP